MNKYICDFCEAEFERYSSQVRGINKFCSKQCKSDWQKENLLGKNNPRYRHGINCKGAISYCSCGNEKDFRATTCNKCYERKPFLGKKHTEENKKIIGKKSKEKFTKDFKIKQRRTYEKLGYWIPLKEKDKYKLYFELCNWIDRMFDLSNEQEKILIEEFNIFNNRTNTKGVVRDHMYSRRSGFDNMVFPEILRHPCNCQIILHSENVKKRFTKEDKISLQELFTKIKNYTNMWKEQKKCLSLIKEYENGKRFNIDLFIKEVS